MYGVSTPRGQGQIGVQSNVASGREAFVENLPGALQSFLCMPAPRKWFLGSSPVSESHPTMLDLYAKDQYHSRFADGGSRTIDR